MKPVLSRQWRALVVAMALPSALWLVGCDTQIPIGNEANDGATDTLAPAAGTGGMIGTGGNLAGTQGTGGLVATGGTTGVAGRSGTGVSDAAIASGDTADGSIVGGSGGGGGMGGAIGTGGGGGPGCVTQSARLSSQIATVGIVTWSSSVPGLKSAKVDFGLDTTYGMTAPVDAPTSGENTTLLLGMKQSSVYHYRITVTGSDGDCVGPDATLQTGALMSGLPKIGVEVMDKSALYGGFLVTSQPATMGTSAAYIADADGDLVWALAFPQDVTGTAMSYDGKWMWINNANVPKGQAVVHRVSMDGERDENQSLSLAGMHHQLTVLPNEDLAFYAYNDVRRCDDIKEYSLSTNQVRTIVNAADALGGVSECRLNDIQYSGWDDTLVFGDLVSQAAVKISRSTGQTIWVLNGAHATYTGDTWRGGAHGMHLLAADRLLVFNNNSKAAAGGTATSGDGTGAMVIELELDTAARQVSRAWTYKSTIANDVMGDVQRLGNGNTVIAYSVAGVIQEVNAAGALLQQWTLPVGATTGYIQKRETLYGPPPR